MIVTITAQCRSKGMITNSAVRTVWKQRYTLQKQKKLGIILYVGPQIGMNPIALWGLPDLEY
jgi:hypothetical protein